MSYYLCCDTQTMIDPHTLTQRLRAQADLLGFAGLGIAKAEHMDEEAQRLEQWLAQDYHGSMSYMSNHFDKRVDPTKLVPGAKSVISIVYNYYTEDRQTDPEAPKIAMYAYGKDYHKVVKKKLLSLFRWLQEEVGDVVGRCFVDSAPVLERDWAKRSGVGWIGKNTLLLNKSMGSYFFLGEIITDVVLEYDGPTTDHCGTCTKCIDACPTDAISSEGYLLDGSKCISYLTIEHREDIPTEFKDQMEGWMFGCDICQQVCPWNRFASPHVEPKFVAKPELLQMRRADWEELTLETYDRIFEGSPVKRTKYEGLVRNIRFLAD